MVEHFNVSHDFFLKIQVVKLLREAYDRVKQLLKKVCLLIYNLHRMSFNMVLNINLHGRCKPTGQKKS